MSQKSLKFFSSVMAVVTLFTNAFAYEITEMRTTLESRSISSECRDGKTGGYIIGTVIVDDAVNVRTAPFGPITGILRNGDKVEIIDKFGDWYRINVNGQVRYIHSDYVYTREFIMSQPYPGIVVGSGPVILRDSPWGNCVGTLNDGQAVTILNKERDFYSCLVNGRIVFISENNMVAGWPGTPPAVSGGETGIVDVRTSLNVRSGPWGAIIGSLKAGDRVKILNRHGDWYEINYGGKRAFVYAGYVRKENEPGFKPGDQALRPGSSDKSWRNSLRYDLLIDDAEFTDRNSMTQAQIQQFLEKKGSCLARPYRGTLPSKLIYDACQKYGISPKVILARLQTEQGLVSKKTATQRQLDWALGVGCYDSGNWNQRFKGLEKQIEGACATYARWYRDGQTRKLPITMKIDGEIINVKSYATYSTYKYCPHKAGAKLFRDVYLGYFR